MGTPGVTYPASSRSVPRMPCEGTPITSTLAPATASSSDDVAVSSVGSVKPER